MIPFIAKPKVTQLFRPPYLSDLLYLGPSLPNERSTLGGLDDQPEGDMVVSRISLTCRTRSRLGRLLWLLTFDL